MKRIIFILIVLTLGINTITDAQQSYQPLYPNYSMQLTKAGSNDPFGDLFTYDGSSTTNYEVGKISNTPTYKRGFYQWNINSNDIPTAAIIDSIVISFGAQYVNYQGSELNYFNCILDLSDPNLNKSALWNYSDRNQYTPIGSGQINTPPSNYVTQTHKFLNGSSFVNAFINSTQQTNRFTLGIAWKYEHPAAYNSYWRLTPLNLKVYFHMPIQTVTLDQRLSNNVQVSKLRKWEGSYFTPSPFINPGTPFNFTVGSTQTIQGDQAIHSNEKYHRWLRNQNDEQDVSNHHSFTIETFDNNFTSRFNPTHSGVKIQNSLEATGIDGGKLEFKDPWLIDYPDPDFDNTPRNRGMAAPFKELTTPYTFTYSSDYKGLFLDQSGPPLWTSSYYSLKMPDEQPITVHNQSRKFFPYSWEETGGVTIQYPWGQETGVVFNSSSNVATAVLKGQLMSKEQTGISSNSQRKMVRTDNGIYHVVYESMGSVWYTHSLTSNYFGDWSTDKNLQGRNPGIAYNGNKIIFVYETINPNNSQEAQIRIQPMTGYDVGGVWIYDGGNDNELVSTYSNTYFGNAKPVIAFTSGQIFVVYRKNATEGLKERTKWYTSGNWTWESEASIPQTNANSINPAVTGTFGQMHIVFESLATIQYKFAYNQGASWRYNNILNLSSGSGFSQNYYPSISISDGDNLYVMVSWQGVYTSAMDKIALKTDEYGLHRYAAVARVGYGASWGGFSNFSNYVKYTNNNSINALAGSILAWSENNGQVSKYVKRRANGLYDPIELLSTNGIHPLISNGSSFENIKAMVFNTSTSAPYLLNRCNNDFFIELLQKESTEQLISYGRSGVVEKDGIEFLFNIGDVSLNGNTIKFIERVDTLPVTSIEEMNSAAVTETFNLNSSSELIFSNYYYVVNKNLADSLLNENFNLTFKSELVKVQGNAVVGTFDVVSYNKYNLDKYANLSYLVDCAGIESGDYFMRLTTTINDDVNLYLSDIQRDDIVLEKAHLLTRNFKGESVPVTYSLEQNYPNPFNPSTTIRYQLPQDGMVTLKVYDILGSEVATLVNEQKAAGKYEVNFDASRRASGVYLYKIQAGNFVQTKKMMLVK